MTSILAETRRQLVEQYKAINLIKESRRTMVDQLQGVLAKLQAELSADAAPAEDYYAHLMQETTALQALTTQSTTALNQVLGLMKKEPPPQRAVLSTTTPARADTLYVLAGEGVDRYSYTIPQPAPL